MAYPVEPGMYVLVRHVESVKNLKQCYSSQSGSEGLTAVGQAQVGEVVNTVERLWRGRQARAAVVLSAPAVRAEQTARPISDRLSCPQIRVDALAPLTAEGISGRSINEVHGAQPRLGTAVSLYRAGLLSGELVPWPAGALKDLYARVIEAACSMEIESNFRIVVAHKSTLTALAIFLMRERGGYPSEYYGYLDIPPASVIAISRNPDEAIKYWKGPSL